MTVTNNKSGSVTAFTAASAYMLDTIYDNYQRDVSFLCQVIVFQNFNQNVRTRLKHMLIIHFWLFILLASIFLKHLYYYLDLLLPLLLLSITHLSSHVPQMTWEKPFLCKLVAQLCCLVKKKSTEVKMVSEAAVEVFRTFWQQVIHEFTKSVRISRWKNSRLHLKHRDETEPISC